MSITDELRKWAKGQLLSSWMVEHLTAIADRIDAEHEKAIQQALMGEGGVPATDENMAEHGWYRALDADKKPIRLGDEVYQVKGGWVYTIKSISFYPDNTTVTFGCEHGFGSDSAHNVRHYHEPTVEDVLRDVVTLCHNTWKEGSAFEFYDVDDVMKSGNIAEFAAKLRLAETEDA